LAVVVRPQVIWRGPASWIGVGYDSPLGRSIAHVGPLPTRVLSPELVAAVGTRVRAAIEQVCQQVGIAIAEHPEICSRCARTMMRSALGSPEDAAAIIAPSKPGDRQRYELVWKAMGPQVQAVQAAMAKLRAEATSGTVLDAAPTHVGDATARLYKEEGWPLKAGQWTDFKLCACGDPTDAKSKPTMLVAGVPALAPPSEQEHHVGGCGCSQGAPE